MHWKYNSGSPSNLPLILGQGFYFTREGLTWILFWSQMKQKLQDTKRLRLVRRFHSLFNSCLKLGFLNFLKSLCCWTDVPSREWTWTSNWRCISSNATSFVKLERDREREVGEWISPLLFPLWQKLWTFGDNHSWHLFYLFGSLFFFYKILKSKDTQFLKKDTELANLEKLKLKPAVNEANERKGKLYPSI